MTLVAFSSNGFVYKEINYCMYHLSLCMSWLFCDRRDRSGCRYSDFWKVRLWQCVNPLTPFSWIQMLLCRLCPWHMCHSSMYSTFNGFDLHSSWMSIMMPSGATQYKAHQQGRVQGLSLIRITPLIWIKILEALWPTAFNHFDVPLKRTSLLSCTTWASADRRWLLYKTPCVCFVLSLSLSGSDRCSVCWSNIHARQYRLP